MNTEVSVSKGVFVNKNGFTRATKLTKIKKKEDNAFSNHLWYKTFSSQWKNIEAKLHIINSEIFASTLEDLLKFLQRSCEHKLNEIPSAALLTGINMPDHEAQFSTLTKEIKENVSPHCVTLRGQDYHNLKLLIENMINGFINDEEAEIDVFVDNEETSNIKKSRCNFSVLQAWYENLYMNDSILNYSATGSPKKRKTVPNRKVLVVIIPDLENFNYTVIQDFILIAHSYINILPFVLIFGIATSLDALHRALPYHVSSKTSIKVFRSQPSTIYLNNVLENVLFTEHCPFSLGGKVFNLFTDIFLFYDLSVTGFIKNFKYAMMEHFSQGNISALCCHDNAEEILKNFTEEDFENLRRIYSFRDLVEREESYKKRIQLLTDNVYLKICLHVLVKDLPKTPLGKQVRELYATVVSKSISKSLHFKECFQLLDFQSKDEFSSKLKSIIGIIENNPPSNKTFSKEQISIKEKLLGFLYDLESIGTSKCVIEKNAEEIALGNVSNRAQLKESVIKMSHIQSKNEYVKLRGSILDYLQKIFEEYLIDCNSLHFHELFFFNDIFIQNQLIGMHRSAIHTALNDPQTYFQCSCCEIQNEDVILPTMPDISIAYKLHLECGKMINLYDWLQAFLSILDPAGEDDDGDNKNRRVDPELQARFTQAIVELEYLGFIKTSKRKTDHVQRLTWGG
ncbi:hypothetical protein HHI36_005005 [Cryptolaemus montrouzieri]|uniref:Origin recognition complex subunit 3 n=1 Tax=Cryptolaemus montrouzieri TaxID=559131 RepID=A0ABD2NT96_9CUCU